MSEEKSISDMTIKEMVEFCNQKVKELKENIYVSTNQTGKLREDVRGE